MLRWDQLHEEVSLAMEVLGMAIVWLLIWRVSRTCLSVCWLPLEDYCGRGDSWWRPCWTLLGFSSWDPLGPHSD